MIENQNKDEQFHKLPPHTRKILITLLIILGLTLLPLIGYRYYKFALNRPAQGFHETDFKIKEGESVSSIADRLLEQELINSEFLFKAYLISEGLHTKIEAGVYRIPAGASVLDLAKIFQHGTNDQRVTFLEGWRAEEYAVYLDSIESLEDVDYDSFLELARENEGYLFPDTYFFNVEADEEDIIDKLLSTYDLKTRNIITNEVLENLGMSEKELLTFASIVEREVNKEEDRPIVAGILINRWKQGQALEADATTQYAVATNKFCNSINDLDNKCPTSEQLRTINWWPNTLSNDDLDYDSPYNTRKVAGLPPKPICNPGLSSIKAIIDYKDTTYNFYLTDKNGITHYSNTLEEHNRNAAEYLY